MNILFVIDAPFPYGRAFSSRARHLIKLMCACGHKVHLIAPKGKMNHAQYNLEMQGVDYTQDLFEQKENVLTFLGISGVGPYRERVSAYLDCRFVDLIFSNSMPYVVPVLLKEARKRNIPYIIEQCEWYDPLTFKFGKYNPLYRRHMYLIEHQVQKLDGSVSISRLLEEYNQNQGTEAIRIPTIVDTQLIAPRVTSARDRGLIHIALAGSIGNRKENLRPMLEAMYRINQKDNILRFHLYGPDEMQLLDNLQGDEEFLAEVKNFTTIYGRIPQEMVEEKVRAADFTFVIRPHRRSSDAGFPTKLAESMSVGTPVIANDTGDIALYVENGVNGFLLKDDKISDIEHVLRTMINMDENQMKNMREEARRTAEMYFDYRNYTERFEGIIRRICRHRKTMD